MMKKIVKTSIAGFIAILCCISILSVAQQAGAVSGLVLDQHAAPVAGASIRLLNTPLAAVTDGQGRFSFPGLAPGTYRTEISAVGFATRYIEITTGAQQEVQVHLTDAARQLDEVVVTAEKQEQAAQRMPLSITALSSKSVHDYRLWNSKDITAITPNLYSADPGDGRNVTAIRGVTTTSYDPAVATYIDGVNQFGLDTYISPLIDIERIEVLRGPQGTLYGRNATGGVINIITKQPADHLTAFAEAGFGNYRQQRFNAALQLPLVKHRLYLGVAGLYSSRDGYYKNTYNNSSYDKQHHFTGNYYLKYNAGDHWQLNLNVKHNNAINHGAFPLTMGAAGAIQNPFKLKQNAITVMHDNTLDASLSVMHYGNGFNFSSQSAFEKNYRIYEDPIDADFSPLDAISIINNYGRSWNNVKVFTEDLRFTSPAHASQLQWTAGLYLFYQYAPNEQSTRYGRDANRIGVGDSLFTTTNISKTRNYGMAVYGQAVYALTRKLDLTAGIRFDDARQKKSVKGLYQPDALPAPIVSFPDSSAATDYHAFSPMASLSYKITARNLVYLRYSRGFRTGGLTDLSADPSQPPLYPYKPEYSSNYELGSKNTLFDNRLQANLSLFYIHISQAQVPTLILPDAITIIRNTGSLESKGIEAELRALPFNNLELEYSAGYAHAKYKTYKTSQNGQEVNLSGHRQVFTPDITSMLAAQYHFTLSRRQQLMAVLRAEWRYLGTTYFDLNNTIEQKPYHLFNARAGITLRGMELSFWARNIFNKKYIAYAYEFGAVHLGDPANWGVSFSVRLK